jgi:aspartyl/asparaginyl beta-hydroxylase (cupin superfamily)
MLTSGEADQLIRAGVAAMQRGAAREARAAFERVVTAGGDIPPPWLLLAQACRLERDEAGEQAALDRLLAAQPRSLRGLIMRADQLGRAGDVRGAHSFYSLAIQVAEATPELPPSLASDVARARAAVAASAGLYREHLEQSLAAQGLGSGARSPRLQMALDLMNGDRQVYLQQPTSFYFPELPQRQFYDRDAFGWASDVEAATDAIRGELETVLASDREFPAYVEQDENRPTKVHRLVGNPDWGAFHLLRGGPVPGNAERCPATLAALAHAPQPVIRGRSPMALFSLLKPGAHIFPHNGLINTRLICHLPLIVPAGCRFRVGNEVRRWEEGRLLIFDDSIEHEAWNEGDSIRVILLFEIWRPEIDAEDRAGLVALFETIDAFRGAPLDMAG